MENIITREDYSKALDIIEAYHNQLDLTKLKRVFRGLDTLIMGDYVKCISLNKASVKCLTIGKIYLVIRVYNEDGYIGHFIIKDDNNKTKRYMARDEKFIVYLPNS